MTGGCEFFTPPFSFFRIAYREHGIFWESSKEWSKGMKKNLLIIEDDEKIRTMLGLYFQDTYNIFEAEDGESGFALLRTENIQF